ncbi:MAG TPA: hypothetical protein V6D28_28785 [Leptolyngbyaceae cyanobacterium]
MIDFLCFIFQQLQCNSVCRAIAVPNRGDLGLLMLVKKAEIKKAIALAIAFL